MILARRQKRKGSKEMKGKKEIDSKGVIIDKAEKGKADKMPVFYVCDPSKNTTCLLKNEWCRCQEECYCTTLKEAAADAFYIKNNITNLMMHFYPQYTITIKRKKEKKRRPRRRLSIRWE